MSRRRKGQPVHGWIVLDKPVGRTSAWAVGAVRRLLDTYETLWRDRIERMEQILAEGSASDSKERDPR